MPFVPDTDQQPQAKKPVNVFDQFDTPKRDEFGGIILSDAPRRDEFGGIVLSDGPQHGFVPDKPNVFDQFDKPANVFDQFDTPRRDEFGGIILDTKKAKPTSRTWTQAAGDTLVDAAKGVVGLGESVVGVTDLVTGNLSGKGWAAMGFDPVRTRAILSELYSDPRQQANRNVADAKGFVDTTKALVQNPSAIVGGIAESAPMMLGSVAAVRTVALKMLAANGLVAGTAEAAAFLSNPAVVARLTAIGSVAEGGMVAGQIQEQGRQAGRDWTDTAPSAVAAGALTGAIGVLSSKIPGFKDAEVGAALAGLSGSSKRQGLITAGKEIAKGTFDPMDFRT